MSPDWANIRGWTTDGLQSFYTLVATEFIKPGDTVAEVGIYFGKSVIFLLEKLKEMKKLPVHVIGVDNWYGDAQDRSLAGDVVKKGCQANLATWGHANLVQLITASSTAGATYVKPGSLIMAFIDASHAYPAVLHDLLAWEPKVKPGGIIAGHDYSACWPGVSRSVEEFSVMKKWKVNLTGDTYWMSKPK